MASSQEINQLFETLLGFLRSEAAARAESDIDRLVSQFCDSPFFSHICFSDAEIEHISLRLKRIEGVTMSVGSLVQDSTSAFSEWLHLVKGKTETNYWNDYRGLLACEQGFSANVLFTIDQQTDRILSKCGDPSLGERSARKGMVVGSVQSGKTANYIGLITKAADYGYKVIIVIAGIPEDLRSQTQRRINEGFVGQDMSALSTSGLVRVGVGKRRDQNTLSPGSFTQEKFDFNATSANSCPYVLDSSLDRPVVFVVKKNASILKNLLQWLDSSTASRNSGCIELPLLLIDDEADNASVNTKYKQDEISKINLQIRLILDKFCNSTYIGYTATPFANIFIDPNSADEMDRQDLFPRDFIVGLEPPSSYIGASTIFLGDSTLCKDCLLEVSDYADYLPLKHKKDLSPLISPSLKDAIYCYFLTDAVKYLRGNFEQVNSSMLINVSFYTDVHARLKFLVHEVVDEIKASIRAYCGAGQDEQASKCLKHLSYCLNTYLSHLEYNWSEVKSALLSTHRRVEVITVNSSRNSTDSLSYSGDTKKSLIVIGGYSLSRGLTLEGLTISYFLRSTAMYDSLLQMGRWFGYRTGYEDLCRIWMTREAVEWYSHIALADAELRTDLATLERSRLTPMDFGLRVRSHPDTLLVTAKNKMGSSEQIKQSIILSNRFVETIDLEYNNDVFSSNLSVAKWIANAAHAQSTSASVVKAHHNINGILFTDIRVEDICAFISGFTSLSILTRDTRPIIEHITDRSKNELSRWDVFIPSPSREGSNFQVLDNLEIQLQKRKGFLKARNGDSSDKYISLSSRGKVAGRGIERIGLSSAEVDKLQNQWLESNPGKGLSNIPDNIFRCVGRKPLIALHFLDISSTDGVDTSKHVDQPCVCAWSISFPPSAQKDNPVEYLVNASWLRSLDLSLEEDDETDLDNGL